MSLTVQGPLCHRNAVAFISQKLFIFGVLLLVSKGYSLTNYLNHLMLRLLFGN
jgi:hypothetical protein